MVEVFMFSVIVNNNELLIYLNFLSIFLLFYDFKNDNDYYFFFS